MLHRLRTLSVVMVASLAVAGIASASGPWPCHPDLAGTRTLMVTGSVTKYAFTAPGTLSVSVRTKRCAGVASWNYTASAKETASVACGRSRAAGSAAAYKLYATQGDTTVRVVLAPKGADRPDRLDVFSAATGTRITSWPLIARPARVALYGGIALLSGADRGALYALRISDGRIAEIAIAHAGDRPVIGAQGIAYQDDIYLKRSRHHLSASTVALKFVPLASVARQLDLAGREIVTSGPISAISMDNQRVAFAAQDPAGKCDRVMFWLPAWHFLAHVSHPSGPTCLPTHAAGGITNVAIAGDRLIWTVKYGNATRVLAASAIGCVEWVVDRPAGRGTPVASLAGDGNVMAYALRRGTVGLVPKRWGGQVISTAPSRILGMSVDSNRIATLYRNGTVTVMTAAGAQVSSFAVGNAGAVALRGNTVAVLRGDQLALYDATTGVLGNSWQVPAGARTVDMAYGIAVIAAGHDVVAVNIANGHSAQVLQAPGRVSAQVDAPGAVVQFNAAGHGHVQFIPMSTLEASTR